MPHQCTDCGYTFADGSKEMLGGCPDCGGNTFQFYPDKSAVPDSPNDVEPPEPDAEASDTASTVGRAATRVRDFVTGDSGPPTDPGPSPESQSSDRPPEDTTTASSTTADANEAASPDQTVEPEAKADSSTAPNSQRSGDKGAEPNPDAPWPTEAESEADDESLPTAGDGIIDADAHATQEALEDAEDHAQANARSTVASDDEVPDTAAVEEDEPTAAATNDRSVPAPGSEENDAAPTGLAAAGEGVDDDTPPDGDGRVVSEPSGEEADLEELRAQLNDQFESIKIVEPGQYELNLMELYDRDEYIIALQENGRYVIQVPEQWLGDRDGP